MYIDPERTGIGTVQKNDGGTVSAISEIVGLAKPA
jgi:hypothetical protein